MHGRSNSLSSSRLVVGLVAAMAGAALLAVLPTVIGVRTARATPMYQQETGRACGFCHVQPPQLNDRGRAFKSTRPWWWG